MLHNEQSEKKSPTCSITDGLKIKPYQWLDTKDVSQKLTGINIIIWNKLVNWSQVGCTPCRLNKAKPISKQLKLNPQPFYTTACFLIALYIEVTCEKVSFHTNLSSLFYFNVRNPFLTGDFTLLTLFPYRQQQSQAFFFFFKQPIFLVRHFLSCWNSHWNLSSVNNATAYCWPQVSLR